MSTRIAASQPALAKLVERQMRNWELARQQRLAESPARGQSVADFICVSRQVGAEGEQVARAIGAELGWPVFDREVLDAMAGDDEMRRRIYESMDARDLTWWEETLRSLMQSEFGRNDYFRRLCETLLSLARQGDCVFLGRGADLILPAERGFRVRIVAPLATRLRRFASSRGLSEPEAEREMERIESDRTRFFRRHFGVDTDDPMRYDMTVNLARFSCRQAVAAVLEARAIRGRS